MNWIAKKLWPSAALSLITGSCVLNADANDDARMRNLENRITAMESRNSCCAVVNPAARPFAKDCWGFIVEVDPLLWQARENGLGFATGTRNNPIFFNSSGENQIKNVSTNWDWGFRLGLGINWAHDAWDTQLVWTRWNTSGSKKAAAGQNEALYPNIGHPDIIGGDTAGNAKSTWRLRLNLLDLETGREFYVSKCLTLRPHVGFRSAWIDQKMRTNFTNLSFAIIGEPDSFLKVKQKCDFWGIGLRGGIDTQWGLGCGWSFFGNFAGSLLYGYFKADYDEFSSLEINEDTTIDFRTDDFYHVGRGMVDMQLGLRYDWLACDECWHFGIEAGWEHHMFFGQNQFIQYVDDVMTGKYIANQGDLYAQGYFIRVRFDF